MTEKDTSELIARICRLEQLIRQIQHDIEAIDTAQVVLAKRVEELNGRTLGLIMFGSSHRP